MHLRTLAGAVAVAVLACACSSAPTEAPLRQRLPEVVRIWPGQPAGTESWSGDEQVVDAELPNLGKVHIVTNVTAPTLTIFRPKAGTDNGTAMIVVPGGAFRALPWDLDGTEPAQWLTDRGITAFVLKYRVRPPTDVSATAAESFDHFAQRTENARAIAVADAEQAVRFVRARARQYGLAPHRLGMIGFSAGAMTAMSVADEKDASVRPDFAVSLYGALLTDDAPAKDAPSLFIVAAQDDDQAPVERSADIFRRWTAAGLPAELHLYEKGGHGFAFRKHHLPVDQWPEAFWLWMQSRGYLAARRERSASGG